MPKSFKRKARHARHRPARQWLTGDGVWAPIYGEDKRVLHHFRLVGEPSQVPSAQHDMYLRTFGSVREQRP
jgi:hypothetical protein